MNEYVKRIIFVISLSAMIIAFGGIANRTRYWEQQLPQPIYFDKVMMALTKHLC